jgi:outer membrane murein-binding lipoprotein Lpp
MKRIGWLAVFLAVITLATGCKNSGTNQNSTQARALHAVVDAEALDVLVDDGVKAAALAFGSTSSYSEFSSGTRDLKARSAVNGAILAEKSQAFASGLDYTLVFYGKRGAIGTLLLTDDTTDPSSGKFKVRLAGLSPDAGAVDLYVVAGDIAAAPATISGAGYASVTDYAEVTAGSYRIVYTSAGTKEVLFQSAAQSFAAGAKLTVAVFPAAAGKLVNAMLLNSASGTFLPNPLARVKAVNAVPDSLTLNFKADGTTLLSNVPFMASSSYVTTDAGAHTLQLEASNVPGATIATLARELDPARDYSAVAADTLGNVELVAFSDDNSLPAAGFAKIRFANARVDAAPVDVLVNFASQASSLGSKGASAYYALAAGNSYSITFATAGGISVIASLETGDLESGAVYTAYLFGTATTPVARLVRDR